MVDDCMSYGIAFQCHAVKTLRCTASSQSIPVSVSGHRQLQSREAFDSVRTPAPYGWNPRSTPQTPRMYSLANRSALAVPSAPMQTPCIPKPRPKLQDSGCEKDRPGRHRRVLAREKPLHSIGVSITPILFFDCKTPHLRSDIHVFACCKFRNKESPTFSR